MSVLIQTPKEAGYRVYARGEGFLILLNKVTNKREYWGLHRHGLYAGFNIKYAGGHYEFVREWE